MRRQRGGAMLFVLVMVGLMTIAVLAGVELSTSAALMASRSEAEAKARYAVDGAMQLFLCEYRKKTKTLPSNSVYTVGSQKVDLRAESNSASKARTIRFTGSTTVQGKSYSFSRVAGDRMDPNPFDYALFSNSNFDPTQPMTLGVNSALGDMSVNGSIVNRPNLFVINGDVESTGTTLPAGATIRGNVLTGESTIPFPVPSGVNYLAAAIVSLLVGAVSDYVFPGLDPYPIVYRLGALDLKGTVTGRGTIFVDGSVTISGNIQYGSADSRLVVIATGGITVAVSATQINGFYYTNGVFRNTGTLKVASGAVAAQSFTLSGPLEIVHDPAFWSDPSEAVKHKLPGYWP